MEWDSNGQLLEDGNSQNPCEENIQRSKATNYRKEEPGTFSSLRGICISERLLRLAWLHREDTQ